MTLPGRRRDDVGAPSADEIRNALDRVLASDMFRGSPQLAAFLRYVVEATLRGEADRIKGYTIAIEALGRDESFDPQTDPIVRVEAARLRRAISRYYGDGGNSDAVQIELPLGSYVPVFRRVPRPKRPPARTLQLDWRRVAGSVALVLAGAVIYAALKFWFDFSGAIRQAVPPVHADHARRVVFPVVQVEPTEPIGPGSAAAMLVARFGARLRDALARFDEIQVVADRPASGSSRAVHIGYRVAASLDDHEDGTFTLTVRLIDAADSSVAYARTFSRVAGSNDASVEDSIVRELSATLAQPYGIIHANERAKRAVSAAGEVPRYRCLMLAYDYWRDYDAARHASARQCLERAIDADPTFAVGFAALATLVVEEYNNGVNPQPGDTGPLQRALPLARRAVELKPGSARAHQALLDVHFARREYAIALQAGEKAAQLNPYDPDIVADYGARLLSLGEGKRGAELLREAAASSVARPAWHDFYLFLAAYLTEDTSAAARYAALIRSDTYPLGLVARLLAAATAHDSNLQRQLVERLVALRPAWRDDPRAELQKFFPSAAIVDRLVADLARAGLGAVN